MQIIFYQAQIFDT